MTGWVCLHRELAEHPIWTEERFGRGQAWVDLILAAAFEDHEVFQTGGARWIKRGQILTSQTHLAARWKWNRETVRRFLRRLESAKMIAIETSKATDTGYTLVTLLNYERFQGGTHALAEDDPAIVDAIEPRFQPPGEPASNRHDITRETRGTKRNASPESGNGLPAQAQDVLAHLNRVAARSFRPVPATLGLIVARLRSGVTPEQCRAVIDAKVRDWRGDPKMIRYIRPETLFNATKFESYLAEATASGDPDEEPYGVER